MVPDIGKHWFLRDVHGETLSKDHALEVVYSINWPVVFYICFGLFVLFILHTVLRLSFSHFVSEIFREFRMLLGRGPINRGKVNALLLIGLICLIAFYIFVDPIRHLIHLTTMLHGTETETNSVVVPALFMICVTGLLSVMALGE
jgi:hypothetical protein